MAEGKGEGSDVSHLLSHTSCLASCLAFAPRGILSLAFASATCFSLALLPLASACFSLASASIPLAFVKRGDDNRLLLWSALAFDRLDAKPRRKQAYAITRP